MGRELPNTRPELERLGGVIDEWDRRKSTALLDLVDLLLARSGSGLDWQAWLQKQKNRQQSNRLLASLDVLKQPPPELAEFDPDTPAADPGRVEGLAHLAINTGDMAHAREAWSLASSYTVLRRLILRRLQVVDTGDLGRLIADGSVLLADLRGLYEKAREALPEPIAAPRRAMGRPREQADRDTEVLAVWNKDPQATYKSVADALRPRYPKLSPEVVEQILRRARIRGDHVRRQVGF